MRLVFLYGPPGAGKLTVARELVAFTGFKLFHNHLTVDLVSAVFPRGRPEFGRLVHRFRREMFAEVARADVDLVFTYVYAHPEDEEAVRDLVMPVESGGGTVLFVQLTCSPEALLTRVGNESRRVHGKICEPGDLTALLDHHNLFGVLPFGESLQIDTTDMPPADAARKIVAAYALPSVIRLKEDRETGVPE